VGIDITIIILLFFIFLLCV